MSDENLQSRRDFRTKDVTKNKPSEDAISELHQMIFSIPATDDEDKLKTIEAIFVFILQFEYDFFRSISEDEMKIIINLTFPPNTKSQKMVSCHSIDLFTYSIKKDKKLINEFSEFIPIILTNMISSNDLNYHISCLAFLNETVRIKNELREMYLSANLPEFLISKYFNFPDKIFFEFLAYLALTPEISPDLSIAAIQSFVRQDISRERMKTVLECFTSFVRAENSLIIPIISSGFIERVSVSLGGVIHTIAAFLKFAFVTLQIGGDLEKPIREAFFQNHLFDILRSSIDLAINGQQPSIYDMMITSINADNSPGQRAISEKEKLIKRSFVLMNLLLDFDESDGQFDFVFDLDVAQLIDKGLPFKVLTPVVRFVLKFSLKMPVSVAQKMINETVVRNAFSIASSMASIDGIVDSRNEFVKAISEILARFPDNNEIKELIESTNDDFDNVIIL